jgi:hypothetical protein
MVGGDSEREETGAGDVVAGEGGGEVCESKLFLLVAAATGAEAAVWGEGRGEVVVASTGASSLGVECWSPSRDTGLVIVHTEAVLSMRSPPTHKGSCTAPRKRRSVDDDDDSNR